MKKRNIKSSTVVTVKDALGTEWDVQEARPTKYGFDLLYGRKTNASQYDAGGPLRLIYTKDLKAFWELYSLRHDGTIFDLPAGRTTLKRARLALGFNWDADSAKFWRRHKAELADLKPQEFEEKYKDQKLTGERMSFWRRRICGGRARPLGWWREPEVVKLLLSERSLNEVRAELGEQISTSQVFRLRRQAIRAFKISNGKPIEVTEDRKDRK